MMDISLFGYTRYEKTKRRVAINTPFSIGYFSDKNLVCLRIIGTMIPINSI